MEVLAKWLFKLVYMHYILKLYIYIINYIQILFCQKFSNILKGQFLTSA